jgi:hypothetical protein
LSDLIHTKIYAPEDLFFHQGAYHSFSHHSRFSGTDESLVLEQINSRIRSSSEFLKKATLLIITFGTANTFRLVSSGAVVSNCHKLPAKLFLEERLSVAAIVEQWSERMDQLQTFNPQLNILFTVSPIRHLKNGAHENQLNKATLLLAVEALLKTHPNASYFPSYEIMLDDLRDYRFYADDLIHPNQQAIDYIWEKFSDAFFDKKTAALIKEYEKEQKALNHRTIVKTIRT